MLRIIRCLSGLPDFKITREQALDIAENYAVSLEWQLNEPYITEGLRVWTVVLDTTIIGSPRIEIDGQSGQIVKEVIVPR